MDAKKSLSPLCGFPDGMRAHVQDSGDTSEAFVVTNGVKQGCVLAPILFCLMFLAMLQDAFHHCDGGICIMYQTDGKLHNQCHLKAVKKVKQTVITDFLSANNCTLNTTSEHDMPDSLDRFSTACNNFSLTISTKKLRLCSNQLLASPISSIT